MKKLVILAALALALAGCAEQGDPSAEDRQAAGGCVTEDGSPCSEGDFDPGFYNYHHKSGVYEDEEFYEISTSAVTVTGTTSTGSLLLEDY